MTIKMCGFGIALAFFAASLSCQENAKEVKEAPSVEEAMDRLLADLKGEGIDVDTEAETIAVPCQINKRMDPIEYPLIHERGKSHEALLVTNVKPSLLNSAFLLLGFEPGKNAAAEPIEPEPTEEEVANGAEFVRVVPPDGMRVWMTVAWTTEDGGKKVEHEQAIEDLILDLTTEEPLDGAEWIYLGGRSAALYRNDPPVFVADYEGNLVSSCYIIPANHLVTMKHERARDEHNWWRTRVCPEEGVDVVLHFHKNKPAVIVNREKRRSGNKVAPVDK